MPQKHEPSSTKFLDHRWADPVTGNVNTQRLSFSQDSAFRIAVGASRTLRNDKTTFSADVRYADYSHASALYDIPASFDSTVKRQGSSRGVYSLAALSAVKCTKTDNVFKRLYDRIVSKRPHKVGVIAVAHKMLLIAHSLVKNNVRWENRLLKIP